MKKIIYFLIFLILVSFAYAEYGFDDQKLPAIRKTTTGSINITNNYNNTNITNNFYNITNVVGGWTNTSSNTTTYLNVSIFGDLYTYATNYFSGGLYSDCARLTTNMAGMVVCAGLDTYALIADVNDWILGNRTSLEHVVFDNQSTAINGSINITGSLRVNGNITITTDNANYPTAYYKGYPDAGGLGSGIVWAKSLTSRASLNVNYTGMTVQYPNFTARLAYSNGSTSYCNIVGSTVVVPDNANTVYYIDKNCAVQHADLSAYITIDVSPGGITDFFNVMTHTGQIEQLLGTSLLQKIEVKDRQIMLRVDNMRVISGFNFHNGSWLNFTIDTGEYQYVRDIVGTTLRNTSNVSQTMEWAYHNGSSTTWGFTDGHYLNITSCDTGTTTIPCTTGTGNNVKYRRHFIFLTGHNNSQVDNTEIIQLLPLANTFYTGSNALADCLNTAVNPLTYTLPPEYNYAIVKLYAYCARADDIAWVTGNLIDMRTIQTGIASGGSSGGTTYNQSLNTGDSVIFHQICFDNCTQRMDNATGTYWANGNSSITYNGTAIIIGRNV